MSKGQLENSLKQARENREVAFKRIMSKRESIEDFTEAEHEEMSKLSDAMFDIQEELDVINFNKRTELSK